MFSWGNSRSRNRSAVLLPSSLAVAISLAAPSALAAVTVDVAQVAQKIDGFGASAAFFSEDISEEDAEWLFSQETGIGLSMLRVRINHVVDAVTGRPYTVELPTAQKAAGYGVQVWAAPWTPPPEWKNNQDTVGTGARLLPANYGAYAAYLADFVEEMELAGVPMLAITPQNEPDYDADWDGCNYSEAEMVTFIGQFLGPEFESRGLTTMIVAPDTARLTGLVSYTAAILADQDARRYTGGLSTHPYGTDGFDPSWSEHRDNNLTLWQTEISSESFPGPDVPDPSINSGLYVADLMYEHLTVLEVSAWNWWNLTAVADNYADDQNRRNPALIQDGVRFKRGYVMGNWSKFVRPGYSRVQTIQTAPSDNIQITAFSADERVVVVVANQGNAAYTDTFDIANAVWGGPIYDVVPWETSATADLAPQTAIPIDMAAPSFTATVPARSVVSFVVDVDLPEPEPDPTGDTGTGGTGGTGGGTDGIPNGPGGTAGTGGTGGLPGDGGTGGPATGGVTTGAAGDAGAGTGDIPGSGPMLDGESGCACSQGSKPEDTDPRWTLLLVVAGVGLGRRRLTRRR